MLIARSCLTGAMVGGLLAMGSEVYAQSEEAAVRAAFSVCLAPPATPDDAREMLQASGWDDDEEAAIRALSSALLASDFRSNDMERTILNAFFVAGSILGNSALGNDQVSMRAGETQLAFLGITEEAPYCVFSGSDGLAEIFQGEFSLNGRLIQSSEILLQMVAMGADGHSLSFTRFDIDALEEASRSFFEDSEWADQEFGFDDFLGFVAPVTASIFSPQYQEIVQ